MQINKKEPLQITTLCYRLNTTFIEANTNILKSTNRKAFYRLSIFDEETIVTEMFQGINPVILGDKIFLNSAALHFHQLVSRPKLKVKLMSHYGTTEATIGQAELNLQKINDNYFQFTQRLNSLQSIIFTSELGELKLIFNIFVQRNKVDLDLYIKKFKQNEREVMRAKRYVANKKKIQAQEKAADIQNKQVLPPYFQNRQKQGQLKELNSTKTLESIGQGQRQRSKSSKRKKIVEVVSSSSSNTLQINSVATFMQKKREDVPTSPKKIMSQIEQKEFNAYSSHIQSFQNSKLLSCDIGSTSIISDGSQASEMINNHLNQTYSQIAVARFKQKAFTCLNLISFIIVTALLYLLLAPSAKIEKKSKGKRGIKISKIVQEIIDI